MFNFILPGSPAPLFTHFNFPVFIAIFQPSKTSLDNTVKEIGFVSLTQPDTVSQEDVFLMHMQHG